MLFLSTRVQFMKDYIFNCRYVYTDEMNLNNFELVCDICYAAKK